MMKRWIAALLAMTISFGFAGVAASASTTYDLEMETSVYDEDGDTLPDISVTAGEVYGNDVAADSEFYVQLAPTPISTGGTITVDELTDSDLFSFKLDRDQNGKYLDTVKLVSKRLDGGTRGDYIEINTKDVPITEEKKVTFDVYFKAKKNNDPYWSSGDRINVRFTLFVSNPEEDGTDVDIDAGDGVVFNPIDNETNSIIWGADSEIASIEFKATEDADKFYAKISTKVDREVYEEYGDPVNADLFFRTFVGNPSIDTTSRATLTLYNPWYDDDYYYGSRWHSVDPYDVYIYRYDDGYLEDVTSLFEYADEDDTLAGIDGWQMRVRSLGTYVISDTQLLDSQYENEPSDMPEPVDPQTPSVVLPPAKPQAPAPTGSHDFMALASALAVLSLGALAYARRRA